MLWQSPTGTFNAIAPPAWLQRDLTLAEPHMSGSRGLVLFADQLPNHADLKDNLTTEETLRARRTVLSNLLYTMGEHAAAGNPDILAAAKERLGCMSSTSFLQERAGKCPVSGVPERRYAYANRPGVFVVILPPAKATTQKLASAFVRTQDVKIPPTVNLWRTALWHELSHHRMAVQSWQNKQVLRARVDEKEADFGMMAGCARAGDNLSAAFALAARSISCLLSPVSAASSVYWNILALHGEKTATETDEIASMLEIKLRTRGYAPHTPDPATFAAAAMGDASYMGLHRFYANPNLNSSRLLSALQDVRREGEWTFRHSGQLARHIVSAGQQLGLAAG